MFVEAGLGDRVVLHGGAAAGFVVPSLAAAARLTHAMAGVPGFEESGALMTITGEALEADNGVDPLGHGSTVWTQGLDPSARLRHAMHVDGSRGPGARRGTWPDPRGDREAGGSDPRRPCGQPRLPYSLSDGARQPTS